MKKILFILFFFICYSSFSQSPGNDTGKYIHSARQYGVWHNRMKSDSVQDIPYDTTFSKDGIARIGFDLYVGNGVYWRRSSTNGGPVIVNAGIDSITYNPIEWCWWFDGHPNCIPFAKDTIIFRYPLYVVQKQVSGAAHDSVKILGTSTAGQVLMTAADSTVSWQTPVSGLTPPNAIKRYLNGYNNYVSFNTDSITEGSTNLYFTNARARTAISLTTIGTSGAATYNNSTGVFNIPTIAGGSTALANIYLKDSTLSSDRIVHQNNHSLTFRGGNVGIGAVPTTLFQVTDSTTGTVYFEVAPDLLHSYMYSTDPTNAAAGIIVTQSDLPNNNVRTYMNSSYGANTLEVGLYPMENIIRLNTIGGGDVGAVQIQDSSLATASPGDVFTLLSSDGRGAWRPSGAGGGTVTAVTATTPVNSSGGTAPNITIDNAAADAATKGVASFTANDFDASGGNISLDYVNGQKGTSLINGFISSGDWSTFNSKQGTISVTSPITLTGASVGMVNQGTTTTVLHGNASGNPSFGAIVNADITNATIDLTTKPTGVLPVANGGTGAATTSQSFSFIGPTSGSGAPSFRALVAGDIPSLSATYLPLTGGILTLPVTTGTGTTAGLQATANSLTTGNGIDVSSSSITTGNLMKLTSTATVGNGFSLSNINSSGANGTASKTVTGETISVTNTGTTGTNVGLNVTASGATNNYAALFTGSVGIGNSAPATPLHITSSTANTDITYTNSNSAYVAGAEYFNTNRFIIRPTTSIVPVVSIGQSGDVTNGAFFAFFGRGNETTSNQEYMQFCLNNAFGVTGTNDAVLQTANAGSGTLRGLRLQAGSTQTLLLSTAGSVGVGVTTVAASSILDVTSTTKGFLPPRMTTTQRDAISSPAEGLIIYNTTTHKLNVFTTAWEAVTSL